MQFKFIKNFIAFVAVLLTASTAIQAQDMCTPIGWAAQNGGTTGGGNVAPVTVTNIADLQTQAKSTGAKVIYVSGVMGAGVGTRVAVAANKTIIGLPGATLLGGFDVKANNIIIRNMKIQGPGSVDVNGVDCITIDGASNVWIDHCDIYDGQDGNMDIVNGANYVAVTWCKFHYTSASTNHQFCNLLGNSDTKTTDRGKLKITMMYNWWAEGCVERMPRVRFGQVHVVNNYFNSRQASYCVRAGIEADILVESNYFDSTSTPIDLYQNNFTAVTSRNNYYVATSGNSAGSGTSFTPSYALTISPAANVKSMVTNAGCGAGATMSSPTACGCGSTPITYYTMATLSNPAAGGSVSGAGSYASGTSATLIATAASGYTFTGWSGDAAGTSSTTTVVMNGNKTATANFQAVAPASYTVTTNANPAAGGTVSGGGTYVSGTTATLTATAAAGYTFTGWSGAATGTSSTTSIVVTGNASVTANFQAVVPVTYTLTTAANHVAGGTISGAGTYTSGTVVTVTATPSIGYVFTGWSGAASGTSLSTTVVMNANLSVVANFQASTVGTSTLRIEDSNTPSTGLCSYQGTLSSNSGANNGKVINLTNSTAMGANWKIVTPSAGAYTFNWRYVNSSTNNVYLMKLILNGVVINSALPFPKTSSSTVFANTTAVLNLNAGSNIIRLESTNGTATADIDWVEVTGNSPLAGNCLVAKSADIITGDLTIAEPNMLIAPNPSFGANAQVSFTLTKMQSVSFTLMGADGRIYQHRQLTGVKIGINQFNVVDIDLPAGLYNIIINGNKGLHLIRKWIVE